MVANYLKLFGNQRRLKNLPEIIEQTVAELNQHVGEPFIILEQVVSSDRSTIFGPGYNRPRERYRLGILNREATLTKAPPVETLTLPAENYAEKSREYSPSWEMVEGPVKLKRWIGGEETDLEARVAWVIRAGDFLLENLGKPVIVPTGYRRKFSEDDHSKAHLEILVGTDRIMEQLSKAPHERHFLLGKADYLEALRLLQIKQPKELVQLVKEYVADEIGKVFNGLWQGTLQGKKPNQQLLERAAQLGMGLLDKQRKVCYTDGKEMGGVRVVNVGEYIRWLAEINAGDRVLKSVEEL